MKEKETDINLYHAFVRKAEKQENRLCMGIHTEWSIYVRNRRFM